MDEERAELTLPKIPETRVATTTAKSKTGLLYCQMEYSATLELSSKPTKVKYKMIGRLFLTNVLTVRNSKDVSDTIQKK